MRGVTVYQESVILFFKPFAEKLFTNANLPPPPVIIKEHIFPAADSCKFASPLGISAAVLCEAWLKSDLGALPQQEIWPLETTLGITSLRPSAVDVNVYLWLSIRSYGYGFAFWIIRIKMYNYFCGSI